MTNILEEKAIKEAKRIIENCYNPYSNFSVGCSIVMEDNTIYSGCNIENASYGLTICAERVAIFNAISANGKNTKLIKTLILYTPTEELIYPCGACRQVISEFSYKDTNIFTFCKNQSKSMTLLMHELLPFSFDKKSLK